MRKLYVVRYEGRETVVECGFCNKELHRFQNMLPIESPNEVLAGMDEKHLSEVHEEELIREISEDWINWKS